MIVLKYRGILSLDWIAATAKLPRRALFDHESVINNNTVLIVRTVDIKLQQIITDNCLSNEQLLDY